MAASSDKNVTPDLEVNTAPPPETVDGVPQTQEGENAIKVAKKDNYIVKSSIGLVPNKGNHSLFNEGEVLEYSDFGEDDDTRERVITRLVGLGALEKSDLDRKVTTEWRQPTK
jgi:hypothetical protein